MSRPSAVRAVLFDAAGTLIEPRAPVGVSYARAAREQGIDLPAWRLDEAFRRVLAAAPPMVFPASDPAAVREAERDWWRHRVRETFRATDQTARPRDPEALFAALWSHFARAEAWRVAPGTTRALTCLAARGLRLGVASNFDHRLPPILEGLGLASFFEMVMLPAEAGAAKPSPGFFAAALARLGVSASDAVYVGDDPVQDLAAARATGLRAVAVPSPATLTDLPERLRELEPPGETR